MLNDDAEPISMSRIRQEAKRQVAMREAPSLLRPPVSDDGVRGDSRLFAEFVSEAVTGINDSLDATELDVPGSSYGGFTTERGLSVLDLLGSIGDPIRLDVYDHCRILGVPYDVAWSTGANDGSGGASAMDGSFFVIGQDNASTTSALGFYLSSAIPTSISVTPSGKYKYNCYYNGFDLSKFRSRGGLGITAYQGGTLTFSREITLWNVRGEDLPRGPYGNLAQGVAGEGSIADAKTPGLPGSFGTYPLAPVFLDLQPNIPTLVWVWAWQSTAAAENVLGSLWVSLPAVQVCSVPPAKPIK